MVDHLQAGFENITFRLGEFRGCRPGPERREITMGRESFGNGPAIGSVYGVTGTGGYTWVAREIRMEGVEDEHRTPRTKYQGIIQSTDFGLVSRYLPICCCR